MVIISVLYHVSKIDLIISTLVLIIKKLNINSMSPYFSPESICHLHLSITNSFWIWLSFDFSFQAKLKSTWSYVHQESIYSYFSKFKMSINPKSRCQNTKEIPKVEVLPKWLNFIRKKADNKIKSHMWILTLKYGSKERNFYILCPWNKKKHLNILTYLQTLPTIGLRMTAHKIDMSVSRNQQLFMGHILTSLLYLCADAIICLHYSGYASVPLSLPLPLISMPFPSLPTRKCLLILQGQPPISIPFDVFLRLSWGFLGIQAEGVLPPPVFP